MDPAAFPNAARCSLLLPSIAGTIVCAVVVAIAMPVAAQGYPTKPIRWIVPFPPGGPVDAASRLVQPKLTEAWGRQVVMDNRAGANGIIGQEQGAHAAPDGYTLVSISNGYTINASLQPKLPFDPHKAFAPVAGIATGPGIVVVHPSLPVQTMQELVALCKSKAGAYSFGSSGNGSASHLGFEMLKHHTGMPMKMTRAEFGEFIREDMARWARVVKISGARLE